MKKLLALAALCTCIVAAAWFSSCNNNSTEKTSPESAKADSLAKAVERGGYLANHVAACIHCHSKRDFSKFSGPVVPGTEGGGGGVFDHNILDAIPGTLFSRNITPDRETGIGAWTDEEVLRAITQGINKNGDTLFPIMPYPHYNRMAKEDLLNIIAYIRTLKPINNKVPPRQLMIPISMAYPAQALQPSVDSNVRPPESDPVKYGEYLVTMGDCVTCHTPFNKGQLDFSRMYAGGNTFTVPNFKVTSANLTPDSATGLGTWTEERFLNKFTLYREEKNYNIDPGKKNSIMPLSDYAGMEDKDLKAIYAYLRTVKPVANKVEKYPQ
ncbi:MAG: c-type cytochrome [Sphingobacteriales bacterium]|nr:c-type cytochrome [Sphingobacteriales bacterium]